MDYDWSGARTRKITMFKRTSLLLLITAMLLAVVVVEQLARWP